MRKLIYILLLIIGYQCAQGQNTIGTGNLKSPVIGDEKIPVSGIVPVHPVINGNLLHTFHKGRFDSIYVKIAAPKFILGSDATGDIYYRNSGGNLVRLGIGSAGQILTAAGGLPSWATLASSVTSVTGTSNRITSSGGTTPAIDISASYVGQSSLTTLGTVTTGTWNGDIVDVTHGGTGTATPALVAGTNVTITGSWPNQTINSSGGGGGSTLTPTVVKTSNYSASVGDFVPCDPSGGTFTVTLPNAPADKSQVAVKIITLPGTNNLVISRAGSDVFNVASGATTLTLTQKFQGLILQYKSSSGIWYVLSSDIPVPFDVVWNDQSGNYTPALTDAKNNTIIRTTSASPQTVTLPSDATTAFDIGAYLQFYQTGNGLTSFQAGAGAVVNNPSGTLNGMGQYFFMSAVKVAANTWTLNNGTPTIAFGGTLTGSSTLTSNTPNWINFGGAWTATALSDSHIIEGGTITADSGVGMTYHTTNPSMVLAGTANEVITHYINPAYSGGSGTSHLYHPLKIRADVNGHVRMAVVNATSSTIAAAGIILSPSSTLASSLEIMATSAGFTTAGAQIASTSVLRSSQSGGINIESIAGQIGLWTSPSTNGVLRQSISNVGDFAFSSASSTGNRTFMAFTQGVNTNLTGKGLVWTAGAHTGQATGVEMTDQDWDNSATAAFAGSTTLANNRTFRIRARTYSAATATTWTKASTLVVDGPPTGAGAGPLTITNPYAVEVAAGNLAFSTAGGSVMYKEGSNGMLGQVALVSGTKDISVASATTSTRCFVTLVSPANATLTVQYQCACTAGHVVIQANVAATTINTADTSTMNYFLMNGTP